MKRFIFYFIISFSLLSCDKENENTLSVSTDINSISILSNEFDGMGNIPFKIDRESRIIYNENPLPMDANLKMLKLDIVTDSKASIKVNNSTWNKIDSVNYASSINITIIAEDEIHKKDYVVRINKKESDDSVYIDEYNAYSYGSLLNDDSDNTMFFNVAGNEGKGYLILGEVGRNKWGLWYTAPFDCTVNLTYSIKNKGETKEPIFEIIDQMFNTIYSKKGVDYTDVFEIYLKKGSNIKMRVTADHSPKNIQSNIAIRIKK